MQFRVALCDLPSLDSTPHLVAQAQQLSSSQAQFLLAKNNHFEKAYLV